MGKKRSLKRYLYRQFDFDFDFSQVAHEQSVSNIKNAIYLGKPFYDTCLHLNFDGECIEDLVKEYVLSSLFEEAQQLTPRQVELMELYSEQTVLDMDFGDILSQLMYFDPQQWFQSFENPIVYLIDARLGEMGLVPSSTLSEEGRKQVVNRMFGNVPYAFDDVENVSIRHAWCMQGRKSGAAYRFFTKFLTQEQFLRPHPNDVLLNNRKERMLDQYEHFKTVLKDALSNKDITADMRQYECELHTGFLYYASSKIAESGIYRNPADKRKADTIVKMTALLTLIKDPELRVALFHTLLNDQPFNFRDDYDVELSDFTDWELQILNDNDIKEGQVALYLSIICTVESALKIFVKDKLKEMVAYFVPIGIDALSDEEQEDALEIKQLKEQLVLYVLLGGCRRYTKDTLDKAELFQPNRYTAAPDDIFTSLYQWTYRVNKDYDAGALYRHTWREWLRQSEHRSITPAAEIISNYRLFADEFENYARIKPEDLGCEDIEKLLKKL